MGVPVVWPVHFSSVEEDGFRCVTSHLLCRGALDNSRHKVPKGIAAICALKIKELSMVETGDPTSHVRYLGEVESPWSVCSTSCEAVSHCWLACSARATVYQWNFLVCHVYPLMNKIYRPIHLGLVFRIQKIQRHVELQAESNFDIEIGI